jgi:hypothetical protein
METFSNTLKKIVMSFTPSQAPQSEHGVSTPHYQAPFILPSSPTLQRLADRTIQDEARRCLALIGEKPTKS